MHHIHLLCHILSNKWALNDKCSLLPQVTRKSHSHVVQWSDVTGCHLLRGRMSRGWPQSLCCFSLFRPSSSNYPPRVLPPLPPQMSQSRNLKYRAINTWRLIPTQSCQTIHPNNMRRSRSLKKGRGRSEGYGDPVRSAPFSCEIYSNISASAIDPTAKKVFFIHF